MRDRERFGWLEDGRVRDQLAAVDRLIATTASAPVDGRAARELHRQLLSPRRKGQRAALTLLAARFGTIDGGEPLLRAAAALEQVHEATLYHDDIVDRSPRRRGMPSLQAEYGSAAAAFAGSELLYASAGLCSNLPARARTEIARTAAILCQGQIREIEAVGDAQASLRRRVEIMLQKTASLFRLAVRLAVILARVPAAAGRPLERFAVRYGLCFQLADDLHDLLGTADTLGREPWQDVRDGVYTVPVLIALRGDATRAAVLQAVEAGAGEDAVARAVAGIAEHGVPEAQMLLARWRAGATAELTALRGQGSEPARRSLARLMAVATKHVEHHPSDGGPRTVV
jgi:heptaprenyl diphosphate synthase